MAIMKKLDHPNIIKLFEIIDDPNDSKLYLITEFVKNGSLAARIRKRDLTENQMRHIFRELITALEYCHKVPKICHRDIKPDNILIDADGSTKLADFGVSLLLPEDGEIKSNAGSEKFFSPEACLGSTYKGRLNDLWACGVTLYMMATGEFPFKGTHRSLQREI
jgi:serine/threonine protein kinase